MPRQNIKKRYESASYKKSDDGFVIMLDDKPALTPLGMPYIIPRGMLAEAICEEWDRQGEEVLQETMPLSHIASVALDLVAKRRADVYTDILLYSNTDLVCYRAGDIPELRSAQEKLDPVIAWAEKRFDIRFNITDGIMPVAQPAPNRQKILTVLSTYDDWKLAALAVAVKPLCSVILALAFTEKFLDGKKAFRLAQLEEAYETQKWGRDDEKEAGIRKLESDIMAAERYLSLLA